MKDVCRISAVKHSPIPLFNFGKQPKTANAYMRVLKKSCFKRDHEKGKLIFSFASSPFLWAKLRKTKGPGTSYQSFRVAKHAQEKFLF